MEKPIKICENIECGAEINSYKSAKRKYCCDQCRQRSNFLKNKILNQDHNEWLKSYKEQLNLIRLIKKRGKNKIRLTTLEDLNFDFGILQANRDMFSPEYKIGEYIIARDKVNKEYCTIKRFVKK